MATSEQRQQHIVTEAESMQRMATLEQGQQHIATEAESMQRMATPAWVCERVSH